MASWRPGEMSEEDREAWLDGLGAEGELLDLEEDSDPEEYFDPDGPPSVAWPTRARRSCRCSLRRTPACSGSGSMPA
jgi:hypothetical protein